MTKVVVVHKDAFQVEVDWANQYAGLDTTVRKDFDTVVNWQERSTKVCLIEKVDWPSMVSAVTDAAATAGAGGTVIIVSGHGGRVPNDPEAGIIIWDPKVTDVGLVWEPGKFGKGLFWDYILSIYTDVIPMGNPPTRKAEDEKAVKEDKSPNGKDSDIPRRRLEAFSALQQIAQALKANKVKRLTFTCCTVGDAPKFIDRIAKLLGVEVAAFKQKTKVFDDTEYHKKIQGKSRLVLESDYGKVDAPGTNGTNKEWARVETPNLDSTSIAYVGKP